MEVFYWEPLKSNQEGVCVQVLNIIALRHSSSFALSLLFVHSRCPELLGFPPQWQLGLCIRSPSVALDISQFLIFKTFTTEKTGNYWCANVVKSLKINTIYKITRPINVLNLLSEFRISMKHFQMAGESLQIRQKKIPKPRLFSKISYNFWLKTSTDTAHSNKRHKF